ncbi:MAG: GNAT family N-acetyltransferase [Bacteroidetes bacterium]|nr:GNAT family N-acetyltransferase [Bacteroidota bacterium]
MQIKIRKYRPAQDYTQLRALIESEGEEWAQNLSINYQEALNHSITYVAISNGTICGYSRSMNDNGLFVWVIDLLVHKESRGNSIGKMLMECLLDEFPGKDVYVMSDVDEYYEKLEFKKEGSIFKVTYN